MIWYIGSGGPGKMPWDTEKENDSKFIPEKILMNYSSPLQNHRITE